MSVDEKLTKYKSAVTIVTADVANSWFGGLYGSSDANNLEDDDPKVIGHIHDGKHVDGHAGKIDLVDHVSNQLRNSNLADDAVTARNIRGFTNQASAIPEFEVINSTTYYYLDLSDLRSEISESGEANTGVNVGEGQGTIFRDKTGTDLNFKSIVAGSGISIVNNSDDITISATGTGENNTGNNVGSGSGEIFRDKTGTTLNFKTLIQGDGISISNNSDDITITNNGVLGAVNLAGGDEGIYTSISANNIQLKSLKAGTGITLESDLNTVTINSEGGGIFTLDTSSIPNVVRQDVDTIGSYADDDFVFGSPSLSYSGIADHANRFFFDKSTGAFRAGGANGTQWDTVGDYSFATGLNNFCSAYGSAAVAAESNNLSGTGKYAFVLGGESNTVTEVNSSGVIAASNNTINNVSFSYAAGSENSEVTADYASAHASYALADSPSKWAIGAGQITTRGAGSAQGGIYICQGIVSSGSTVNLLFQGSSPFRINNNSVFNVDIDVVVIYNNESFTTYGGGRIHGLLMCDSTGAVTATNNGIVYGNLTGFTPGFNTSTANSWFPTLTPDTPATGGFVEVVCHIRTTEIISEEQVLDGTSAIPDIGA